MRRSGLYVATVGMLTAALAFGTWSERRPTEPLYRPLEEIPTTLGPWHAIASQQLTASVQEKLKATSYLSRSYTDGNTTLNLFIAYYRVQKAGESMHSPKHCLPGAGWDISRHEDVNLSAGNQTVTVNQYDIQNGPAHELTLYWYQSRDRIIANEYRSKMMLAYDSIVKGRTAGSIVRIICPNTPEAARVARNFAQLVIPEMHKNLSPQ